MPMLRDGFARVSLPLRSPISRPPTGASKGGFSSMSDLIFATERSFNLFQQVQ
jgi:hypothetical protein